MTTSEGHAFLPGSIDEHLDSLRTAGRAAMADALTSHRLEIGRVHQADLDIGYWAARASGPIVSQLQAARKELALAEYCVAVGLYRQAYATLRLFLELSFASIHFSVNEFERRLWVSDRLDFSWSGALSDQDGLLSTRFVREFSPTLVADAHSFATVAAECYRHCSQFVHGKDRHSQTLPLQLAYSGEVVSDWCTNALHAAECLLFLLYIRFGDEFDVNGDAELQDTIVERFGHLFAVRSLLGLSED